MPDWLIVLLVFAIGVFLVLSDRRWHKQYPEANARFSTVDDELTAKGE